MKWQNGQSINDCISYRLIGCHLIIFGKPRASKLPFTS